MMKKINIDINHLVVITSIILGFMVAFCEVINYKYHICSGVGIISISVVIIFVTFSVGILSMFSQQSLKEKQEKGEHAPNALLVIASFIAFSINIFFILIWLGHIIIF
ncbi:MAG: hypothetical protein Q7S11_02140 [bacterium]|nr:hypothetical protein [bacterium]